MPPGPTSIPAPPAPGSVDVLVATYNSAATLERCLTSADRCLPGQRLLVVDRSSTDATARIARAHGAELLSEDRGLGFARNLALRNARTDPVVFLDSDVEIVRSDFLREALAEYRRPGTAAVVGTSVGHPFAYGLPLGLTLVGREWALAAGIPDDAQGRETYYLQQAARRDARVVRYVREAMVHRNVSRRIPHWPEFQGAAIRRSSGWDPRELAYAAEVVVLMHVNSRSTKNVLYSPIFYLKLLRGFLDPARWARLERPAAPVTPG